jgi:hypothetical protein
VDQSITNPPGSRVVALLDCDGPTDDAVVGLVGIDADCLSEAKNDPASCLAVG